MQICRKDTASKPTSNEEPRCTSDSNPERPELAPGQNQSDRLEEADGVATTRERSRIPWLHLCPWHHRDTVGLRGVLLG